jgi:hypothetical protein
VVEQNSHVTLISPSSIVEAISSAEKPEITPRILSSEHEQRSKTGWAS